MDKDQPFIHLGFPKCASSFLQDKLFPNLKGIEYLPDAGEETLISTYRYQDLPSDLTYFRKGKSRYLISHECYLELLGSPIVSGDIISRRELSIRNLTRMFKDYGQFIIVVRRQDDVSQSAYKFLAAPYVGHYRNLYIDFPASTLGNGVLLNSRAGMFYIDTYNYYTWISRVADEVGKDRVHVVPYEDLKMNPPLFVRRICEILGENAPDASLLETTKSVVNASERIQPALPPALWPLRRLLTNMPGKDHIRKIFSQELSLSQDYKQAILDYFREGNRKLDEEFDVGLGSYGYY